MLMIERVLLVVLLSMVVWQSKRQEIKRWWKAWRAKPKRTRQMQPRTPEDSQVYRLAEAERGLARLGTPLYGLKIGRSGETVRWWFVHGVKTVLAVECVPVFASDGLQQYFYVLTAHLGRWVEEKGKRKLIWQVLPSLLYGQFRRLKVGCRLKHVYTEMLCGMCE